MGDELPFGPGTILRVHLPRRADLRLIHDGETIVRITGNSLDHAVASPGLYRVEAWRRGRCWIFSNHIRIGV